MGQIRKIGELYYIEFHARGLMYSQVAGSKEEEAKKLLEQIETKISQGEALTIAREIDLEVFYEKFLSYAQERFSAKSIQRFTNAWKHWTTFLSTDYSNIKRLSQITPSVIESYKTALVKQRNPRSSI